MGPRGRSVADVAERLMVSYENDVPLEVVSAVVLEARSELSGQVPQGGALPERLYRLADERLSNLARSPMTMTVSGWGRVRRGPRDATC